MTAQPTAAPPTFEPASPAFRADPYPAWAALRSSAPVKRLRDGEWVVTGYDQVRSLLRDRRTATGPGSAAASTVAAAAEPGAAALARVRESGLAVLAAWMNERDPADHARLRRLTRPFFTDDAVRARRARVEELVSERIDRALAHGGLDVIADLARPVALTVAAELVGIPRSMQDELSGWAREVVHRVEVWPTSTGRERGLLAVASLASKVGELLRSSPPDGDTLLSNLDRARADGSLSEIEVISHAVLFFFSAHVTTQHLIGNAVLALLRQPDQLTLLRDRREATPAAVEEFIRYDTPGPVVHRVALEDIELDGQLIPSGERLLLVLAAAHRDPAVFADPDRLDVLRSLNPHLGFGRGAHYCVGAALARLEAEVAIGALVQRSPGPELATAAPEWEDSFVVRGLRSLPVTFT